MDIIDKIKILTNNSYEDIDIEFALEKARQMIRNYLGVDDVKAYAAALIKLAIHELETDSNVTGYSEGGMSVTYKTTDDYFKEIKKLLPLPKLRLF